MGALLGTPIAAVFGIIAGLAIGVVILAAPFVFAYEFIHQFRAWLRSKRR